MQEPTWNCVIGQIIAITDRYPWIGVQVAINSLASGRCFRCIKRLFSNSLYRIVACALAVKLLPSECQNISLMICQHWFREWLGAIRQQAIAWANVDPDLCRNMVSLGHNESRWKLDTSSKWSCLCATRIIMHSTEISISLFVLCTKDFVKTQNVFSSPFF